MPPELDSIEEGLWDYAMGCREACQDLRERRGRLILMEPIPVTLEKRCEEQPAFQALALACEKAFSWEPSQSSAIYFGPNRREQFPRNELRERLRRSGFYHSIVAGESDSALRERFARIVFLGNQQAPATWTHWIMLDGCVLPRGSYSLLGCELRHLDANDIARCGLPSAIGSSFFPDECLEREHHADRWYLTQTKQGVAYESRFMPWEKSTGIRLDFRDYAKQLAALSIYHPNMFNLPVMFSTIPAWRTRFTRREQPSFFGVERIPNEDADYCHDFIVTERNRQRFEGFLRLASSALEKLSGWKRKGRESRLEIGLRRFLDASLRASNLDLISSQLDPDVHDELVTQYVVALEALVIASGQNGLADRVATRSALLAGRDDVERRSVFDFVKKAYNARSALVHGDGLSDRFPIADLRHQVRRCAGVLLALSLESKAPDDLEAILKYAPISSGARENISKAQSQAYEVLDLRDGEEAREVDLEELQGTRSW